jgi:organic radical activating enzyme
MGTRVSVSTSGKYNCPYLNNALMISPYSEVRPCCRFDANLYSESFIWDGKGSLSDFYSSGIFKELRENVANDKEIKGCHRCYREEKLGIPSMRQKAFPSEIKQSRHDQLHLSFIELAAGRVCNLKCRSCNASFSTKWESDAKAINQVYAKTSHNIDLNNISNDFFKHTRSLKITGGEPFLNPGFKNLILRLVASHFAKQISLEIFTNTTIKPESELLLAFKKFESVTISMSIDAVDHQNKYIRNPSSWEKTVETSRFWVEQKKSNVITKVGIVTTVTNLNILSLFDLIEWSRSISNGEVIDIIFQIAHDPKYLSVALLPKKIRDELMVLYTLQWAEIEKKISLSSSLKTRLKKVQKLLENNIQTEETLNEFLIEMKKLDHIRTESFSDTFPVLSKIYQYETLAL